MAKIFCLTDNATFVSERERTHKPPRMIMLSSPSPLYTSAFLYVTKQNPVTKLQFTSRCIWGSSNIAGTDPSPQNDEGSSSRNKERESLNEVSPRRGGAFLNQKGANCARVLPYPSPLGKTFYMVRARARARIQRLGAKRGKLFFKNSFFF